MIFAWVHFKEDVTPKVNTENSCLCFYVCAGESNLFCFYFFLDEEITGVPACRQVQHTFGTAKKERKAGVMKVG